MREFDVGEGGWGAEVHRTHVTKATEVIGRSPLVN